MRRGESQELASNEVTGMRRYDVEEASLGFAIAEGLQHIEMSWRDIHSDRIRAVISRSSRTRRGRPGSSGRL